MKSKGELEEKEIILFLIILCKMSEEIKLNQEEAKELVSELKEKPKSKLKRWKDAVKNMSPERMLINRYWGQMGTCIGMFAALILLIITKVYWILFFMPFIFFLQLLNLLSIYQQLKQLRQMDAKLKEIQEQNASYIS